MKTITIFHSINSNFSQTVFSGEHIGYSLLDDGVLLIRNWQTDTEQGHALFTKGEWAYVCQSEKRI